MRLYDRFYKSCWNAARQDAGYFACAQISTMQSRLEDALDEIDRSLIRNWHNHKARALKTAILRRMGRTEEALQLIEDSLAIDKFNFGCRYEKYLITNVVDELSVMKEMMRGEPHNYDEIALDYCAAGCWQEAASLWNIAIAEGIVTPMTYYYLGWCLHQGTFRSETGICRCSQSLPRLLFSQPFGSNSCFAMCHGTESGRCKSSLLFG